MDEIHLSKNINLKINEINLKVPFLYVIVLKKIGEKT